MRKRTLSLALAVSMAAMSLAGCGGGGTTTATTAAAGGETAAAGSEAATEAAKTDDADLSDVEKIIKEAEGMSMEELAKKAIEESNGKTFYGVGNSSRGKSALPLFIEYLQSIDPSYNMEYEWQQPKNNKIFEQLTADDPDPGRQPDPDEDGRAGNLKDLYPEGMGRGKRDHTGCI